MGRILFPLFIAVPIIEIAVFIQAGEWIGLWPTIGCVVLTAAAGAALLRHQGLATLARVQQSLQAGLMPMAELFDGLCLLAAGALLLTPGFFTDAIGLLLFTPPFRAMLARFLGARARLHVAPSPGPGPGPGHGGPVIDGDFREVDPANNGKPAELPRE